MVTRHSVPPMHFVRDELNRLGSESYTHAILVFTRPGRGLGALVACTMLVEIACPAFSSYNVLRTRVLARTDSGAVHEWVLNCDRNGIFLPMTQNDFLGVVDRSSMRVRGGGLLVAYTDWATGPGWVLRRDLRDWDLVARA